MKILKLANDTEWIGVDLDDTLAHYEGFKGADHIGELIPKMLKRVKQWLSAGKVVKIFTARASGTDKKKKLSKHGARSILATNWRLLVSKTQT